MLASTHQCRNLFLDIADTISACWRCRLEVTSDADVCERPDFCVTLEGGLAFPAWAEAPEAEAEAEDEVPVLYTGRTGGADGDNVRGLHRLAYSFAASVGRSV
jgi:hypothetical protein